MRQPPMTRKERERAAYLERQAARQAQQKEQRRSLRLANALDAFARRLDENGRDSDEEFGAE